MLPTWKGWLVLLLVCGIPAILAARHAYYFLAMNAPVPGGILVVEGWGPDFFMIEAAKEYQRNHYDGVYVTGVPIEAGASFTNFRTYADMGGAILEKMGIDSKSLHVVPAEGVARDRTYTSALALKKWLSDHNVNVKVLTVITVGAHARRSHLLYEKAFGDGVNVGVIAVRDEGMDPDHWWRSSPGFRAVTDEMAAYIYARFLFHEGAEK